MSPCPRALLIIPFLFSTTLAALPDADLEQPSCARLLQAALDRASALKRLTEARGEARYTLRLLVRQRWFTHAFTAADVESRLERIGSLEPDVLAVYALKGRAADLARALEEPDIAGVLDLAPTGARRYPHLDASLEVFNHASVTELEGRVGEETESLALIRLNAYFMPRLEYVRKFENHEVEVITARSPRAAVSQYSGGVLVAKLPGQTIVIAPREFVWRLREVTRDKLARAADAGRP